MLVIRSRYARQVFKEFALSGRASQDQTKLAFPFYYEIDDLMYYFRELVRDDNGVKQFSTASQPNLLRSMLSLQRLPDLCSYGRCSRTAPFCLNFSYVCPEPVLAK